MCHPLHISSPWRAHLSDTPQSSMMYGLSIESASLYLPALSILAVILTALCGILLQRRKQSMDTALEQKKHDLVWQQVKDAMDRISAGHTARDLALDQYWLFSISSTCTPTSLPYTWTRNRCLSYSAAVMEYESKKGRWESRYGQTADSLGC